MIALLFTEEGVTTHLVLWLLVFVGAVAAAADIFWQVHILKTIAPPGER